MIFFLVFHNPSKLADENHKLKKQQSKTQQNRTGIIPLIPVPISLMLRIDLPNLTEARSRVSDTARQRGREASERTKENGCSVSFETVGID